MFQKLEVFQMSMAMAQHAGARQAVVARNMANADTPGYQAERIGAFHEYIGGTRADVAKATRPGHIASEMSAAGLGASARSEPSPNGNSVSLEQELLASVEAQREHSRALALYKHGLDILRMSIGRR